MIDNRDGWMVAMATTDEPVTAPGTGDPQQRSATPAQLRQDIDSGRTADKIPFPDPAAAPLGTDEEAAGTPVSSRAAAAAIRAETARREPPPPNSPTRSGRAWIVITLIVAAAVLVAAGVLLH
jgi:hypothetical protein